ncbi:hypothetical protein [Emticicia sp. W12TSBA100-4]|uniref:hypothetical protein n=1 Tax=Emticicia sp. W12TSBA100-4 TaxID=3160965 RepID=UPI0033068958
MKNTLITFFILLGFMVQVSAQSSTITPQGVMFPQMSTTQINALTSQAKGTMVFDNTLNIMKYWDGTAWQNVSNAGASGSWQNSGTNQYSTNSGNVGIGISTPQAKLSVNGNLGLYDSGVEYGFLSKNSTNGALRFNAGLSFNAFTTPKNLGLQVNSVNGLGSTLVAGNVGIGTDEPEDKFTTYTPSDKYGILHSNGTVKVGSYIGGNAGWLGTKSNHPLIIHTNNGANQHYFRENGRVGLGIEFPDQKLHVNGGIKTEAGIFAAQTGDLNLVPIGVVEYQVNLLDGTIGTPTFDNIAGNLISSISVRTFISIDDHITITLTYNQSETAPYSKIIAVGSNNIANGARYYSGTEVYNSLTTEYSCVHTVDDMPSVNPTVCSGTLMFYGIKKTNNN